MPTSKVKIVAKMLTAIHVQENKKAAREKAKIVVAELKVMKLKEAAKKVEDGIEETLAYCDFPSEHWISDYYACFLWKKRVSLSQGK